MYIRISFTSYINKIIKNTAINYKKQKANIIKKEIQFSYKSEIEEELMETKKDIKIEEVEKIYYQELEKVFTQKEYYDAMKVLKDKEKYVLYLSIVKQLSLKTIAILLNTNENNVSKIKHRAKNTIDDSIDTFDGVGLNDTLEFDDGPRPGSK